MRKQGIRKLGIRKGRWAFVLATVGVAALAVAAGGKSAEESAVTGWGAPNPADMSVIEELEGENLAEARKMKGATLEIQSARKDLDGDGIPEIFVFVKHPMFCYEESGCTILVIRRASLSDPWREIGAISANSPSLTVLPGKGNELPGLRVRGPQSYTFDGQRYQPETPAAPSEPASGAAPH